MRSRLGASRYATLIETARHPSHCRCGAKADLPFELQIARAIAAVRSRSAAVIAPEVDGLAAQGIGAAEPALEPGAAGQAHLKPALRTSAHWAAHALTAVAAVGRGKADDAGRIAIGSDGAHRRDRQARRQQCGSQSEGAHWLSPQVRREPLLLIVRAKF